MQTIEFDRLQLMPGQRVLDLGCGQGRHTLGAAAHAEVVSVGVDLGFEDLLAARDAMQAAPPHAGSGYPAVLQADGLSLPFPDACFDVVVCSEVLEHIPDYAAALSELNRVLRPGGKLAVSVPSYGPEWLCWALSDAYHEVPGGHVRIFCGKALQREIEDHGFEVSARHRAHALHSPYWWLQCALWRRRECSRLVKAYHRLLVWDMMKAPALTRKLEQVLNPLIGKSTVMYFTKG